MSVRKMLGVRKPEEVSRKVVGDQIILSSGIVSVRVPLKAWNITGLDTKV